ncbi:hypothetical protein [Streptomyces sp. NPDC050560]|uniref:hypothetical protein n=1 Tax=Streptomyces sp. NPDC050560 TaxID=3365630 RepID=UPI0037A35701
MSEAPEETPRREPVTAGAETPTEGPSGTAPRDAIVFDDPLTRRSSDDTDHGWGERSASGDAAADLARFLDEKPPHHL